LTKPTQVLVGESSVKPVPLRLLVFLAALAGGGLSCSPESTTTSAAESVEREGQTVVFTDVTEAAGLGAFRHENGAVGNSYIRYK